MPTGPRHRADIGSQPDGIKWNSSPHRRPESGTTRSRQIPLTPQAQLVTLLAIAGTLLSVLGYRIRFRREWHLIGGINCNLLRDPVGFGNWIGGVGLVLGSVSFGAAALALTRPDLNAALGQWYAAAVLGAVALLVVGSLRYIF